MYLEEVTLELNKYIKQFDEKTQRKDNLIKAIAIKNFIEADDNKQLASNMFNILWPSSQFNIGTFIDSMDELEVNSQNG